MTVDIRWQSYNSDDFIFLPLMFYFGGNHVHFTTGSAVSLKASGGDVVGMLLPMGLNCDFGKHFGIDALTFFPLFESGNSKVALSLDFRFVF